MRPWVVLLLLMAIALTSCALGKSQQELAYEAIRSVESPLIQTVSLDTGDLVIRLFADGTEKGCRDCVV